MSLLPMYRGDTYFFTATVVVGGQPIDLNAYSIWCTGKRSVLDADVDAVFQLTKGEGIVVTGTNNNIAQMTILPAMTSGFTRQTNLEIDVQIEVNGMVYTVAKDRLSVRLDVTRTS
jgi:hypothetical protein